MALGVDLQIDASLGDVGGHFVAVDSDERAEAPSAADIASAFGQSEASTSEYDVAVDVSRLPEEGPWDSGHGFETIGEARLRAAQMAETLSEMALMDDIDVLVLVTHDAFLKLLLTALLLPSAVLVDPAGGGADGQEDLRNFAGLLSCEILNTATTALDIDPFGGAGAVQLLWLNRIDHFLLSARM